jgi:benzoyl-CoA reductase/2-hydroxyglutaryl-CoA dehydratase subunit BcrC/BadD/HgdB
MPETAAKVEILRSLTDGYIGLIQRFKGTSDEKYFSFLADYYTNVLEVKKTGLPLGQYNLYAPVELCYGMGIVPYLQCHTSAVGPGLWDCTEYLELAQGYGIANEFCSFEKLRMGYILADCFPRADLMISTNLYCTASIKVLGIASEYQDVPNFLIDAPYSDDEESVTYYRGQLQKALEFMEEKTGKKLDMDRLREVARLSHEAVELYRQILQLRHAAPCPLPFVQAVKGNDAINLGAGTAEAVDYLKCVKGEVEARAEAGQGGVADERHRVAWWGAIPFFDPKLSRWLADTHGVAIVADNFTILSPTPLPSEEPLDDPLRYIARKTLGMSIARLSRPYNRIREDLIEMTRKNQADCSVIFTSLGCKQLSGLTRLMKDSMSEDLGLPTLVIDGDYCDYRVVSSAQIRAKVDEFFTAVVK